MSPFRRARRLSKILIVLVVTTTFGVVVVGSAQAAGVSLFDQTFKDATASGTGAVVLPATAAGATVPNAACLTSTGNSTSGPLLSCPSSANFSGNINDTPGSGVLQLTPLYASKVGGVFAATSVPTSQGLDVSFVLNQYGGGQFGADGIAFALSAVNPLKPTAPPAIGSSGGFLGYSASSNLAGLANGYLGIGFDAYGNFSNKSFQGTGCPASTFITEAALRAPAQVLIRGPGNGKVGYCAINGTGATASTATPTPVPMQGTTRANSSVPVRILINSSRSAVVTESGFTVAAESYLVIFTPIGQAQRQLTGALPQMAAGLVGAPTWLDSDGLPKQLAFGWVASTGGNTDHHEVTNVKVTSLSNVAQLSLSQLSYTPAGTTLAAGDPISYVVTPGIVAGGLAEAGAITVTATPQANIQLLGATGPGWVCGAPVGLPSCVNSNGPFAAGSVLPPITVTAVAGAAISQAATTVSVATASSDTGLAGYSTLAPAGTNPTAPTITALSSAVGSTAGGNQLTITGTNLTDATSIQIGSTAEMIGLNGSTLFKCAGAAAAGCFTVVGSTLVISSMPAHAAAAALPVKVVNLGTSAVIAYRYAAVPGTPVVTATAGFTGATVTWTTPANGGSAITAYSIQGYKNGTAVPALTHVVAAGTNTFAYTGLDAGGSYTFTVAATNALAYGDIGTSNAVVPYTVPTAPLSPTATAGTGQAGVSWLAPSSDGSSPITGYTITPYLGSVAQTPQLFASANLTQTVLGLTAGSSYQFTVAATNAAGTGTASAKTAPIIVNAGLSLAIPTPVQGEVGVSYSNPAFTANDGTGPFSWSVLSGSLPAGLTLSAAGVLSGLPTAAGSSTFTVQVTDAQANTATQALTLVIVAAPVLGNAAPPNGQVGVVYSNQLTVQGGTGPFLWSISSGALPAGLTLGGATGLLSGTPTAAGASTFTVSVSDAFGQSATQPLGLTVNASPAIAISTPPPVLEVGVPFSRALVVTGGTGPFTWSAIGNVVPGFSLNPSTGVVSGTPTTAGSYPMTITVRDSTGQSASQNISLFVAALPSLTFTPPAGEAGAAYSAAPVLTGGTAPFSYSLSAGTLPAGLSLATSTGVISGNPTVTGSSAVTVRVVDQFGKSSTAAGTIVIGAAPSLANPALPTGDAEVAYRAQLVVSGGAAPFAWSIPTGNLPAGVTLDAATGVLSGTPSAGGSFPFTVRVVDGFGLSASQQLTLKIRAAASVTLGTSIASVSPGGSVGLTATVTPLGATGTVTFTDTITSGPNTGTSTVVGSAPVGAGGIVQSTVTLAAFGGHSIVASYGGDASTVAAVSAPSIVQVVGTTGSLIVSEFRLSGPAGAADQYVELTNVSNAPIALGGFTVAVSSGTVTTMPAGVVLAAGRAYLVAGAGYSLSSVAAPDLVAGGSLGSGGIAVHAPDSSGTVTDAVGPSIAGYFLGTPLPAFTGSPIDQFGWVRTQQTSYLKNTGNNLADFALVSASGGLVGGVQSMLGSPAPTGSTSPWLQTFSLTSTLVDPSLGSGVPPNRVTVRVKPGVPGSLLIRRVITNHSADTVTTMRIRLHSLSEANGLAPTFALPPGATVAALRAVNPGTQTTTIMVAGQPVVVQNLGLDPPAVASPGGGLNTTYTVPLPSGGLAPGATVAVAFSFTVDTGGSFWFGYDVDASGLG